MKEYEDMKAAGNGQSEEFEEKEKGWKKTIEEIFSLIKKLLVKTSGQKMEKDSEERLNEISRSQGSETKIGIKRNVEELQEKEEQPFPDCQWDGKEDKERRIKKKKVRRKEGQILTENEEGKKKKTRMITRKRREAKDGASSLKKERKK